MSTLFRLDSRIDIAAASLRLYFSRFDEYDQIEGATMCNIATADSNGRFLTTPSWTKSQAAHCAAYNSFHKNIIIQELLPCYISIATRSHDAPLWILPGSHVYSLFTYNELEKLSAHLELKLTWIRPYFIFVGRRDLIHTGSGCYIYESQRLTRYHTYFKSFNITLWCYFLAYYVSIMIQLIFLYKSFLLKCIRVSKWTRI